MPSTPRTAVVFDPDPANARSLEARLRRLPYRVLERTTSRERLLEAAASLRPDLVVIGVGGELAEAVDLIRSAHPHVASIVAVGEGDDASAVGRLLAAGALAYLPSSRQ